MRAQLERIAALVETTAPGDLIPTVSRFALMDATTLCRAAGIPSRRQAELNRGAKATKTERAALSWAIALNVGHQLR